MNDTNRLHLSRVAIEHVKGIRGCQVEISDGSLIEVTGGNGDGKSSFIDAIWYALLGTQPLAKGRKLPKGHTPVTQGEDSGSVVLSLDGHPSYVVTRRWDGAGRPTVQVVNSDTGRAEREPVALLRSLVGPLAVDPLKFMDEPEGKQVATLAEALRLELMLDGELVDLDTFDEAIAAAMAERGVLANEAERLQAIVDQTPAPDPGLPSEPVSVDDLLSAQREAQEVNAARRDAEAAEKAAVDRVSRARDRLNELRDQVAAAEREVIAAREELTKITSTDLPDEVDEDAIREQIAQVAQTNTLIENGRRRAAQVTELAEKRAQIAGLEQRVAGLRSEKKDTLAKAPVPYPGLSIDLDGAGLTLNGIPLKDCSAAEQRLVACGLAMDPEAAIRLIRVEDGSLLDVDFLASLETMATERDYQVLIEIVDPDSNRGIVFSEGSVISVDGQPTP